MYTRKAVPNDALDKVERIRDSAVEYALEIDDTLDDAARQTKEGREPWQVVSLLIKGLADARHGFVGVVTESERIAGMEGRFSTTGRSLLRPTRRHG